MTRYEHMSKRKKIILFVVLTYLRDAGNAGNIQDLPYGVLSIIKHNEDIADFHIIDIVVSINTLEESIEKIRAKVKLVNPDIAGISVMFDNAYHAIRHVSKAIKSEGNIFVVLGGAAVSSIANEVVQHQESIDAVCYSEGEIPMRDLIESDDLSQLVKCHPSWASNDDSNYRKSLKKSLLENLNEVADIDYSYLDIKNYERRVPFNPIDDRHIKDLISFPIVTSRGCPFKCTFCWHSGDNDTSMRYADVDKIIAHIDNLKNQYGANCIIINDDMLLLNRKRAKELFKRLSQFDLRIELPNGLSPAYIDDELVELMYAAGVRSVRLAIESGDNWVIRHLVNKPLHIDKVDVVMKILKRYNIWVVGFFVIGLPGESNQQRQATRDKIIEWGIDQALISIASPTKGSLLYEQCIKEGYIKVNIDEPTVGSVMAGENIINTKEFSAEEISRQSYLMNLEVNFIRSSRLKSGDYATADRFFSHIVQAYNDHGLAHYCLSQVKLQLQDHKSSHTHHELARSIYLTNSEWRSYFQHFGIFL